MPALRPPLPYVVPPSDLRGAVDRVWACGGRRSEAAPTLLPGTGAELVLQRRANLYWVQADGTRHRLPRAFVFCFRSRSCRLWSDGPVEFTAVRFRGSGLRHFTRLHPADLADRVASVEEVFGPGDGDLDAALVAPADLATEAGQIFAFLRGRQRERTPDARAADATLDALYYAEADRPLAALAVELGWSLRQLERIVAAAAGLTPKRFRRIARFHHTMRQLHLGGSTDYLATALAHGYHDQAHFIHECRSLTGRPPGQVLTPAQLASHFYNPSLPR